MPVELKSALTWMPDDGIYLYHLGLAHHRLEQWQEAIAAYERAWQAQPSWRVAYHQALATLQAGGELLAENWDTLLARLTETMPATAQGKHAVARLVSWHGHLTETAGRIVSDTWLRARNLPALIEVEVGLFHLATGDAKTAGAKLSKALKNPETDDADLAAIPAAHRLVAAGAALLAGISALNGASKPVSFTALNQWLVPLTQGKRSGFAAGAAGVPVCTWLLWQAGWLAVQRNMNADAYRIWERALEITPKKPEFLHNQALVLENDQAYYDAEEAWENYARALKAAHAGSPVADRQWSEQVATQVYMHLCRSTLRRDPDDIEPDWLEVLAHSRFLEDDDRLELAKIAAHLDEPQLVRHVLLPLHSQLVAQPDMARQIGRIYQEAGLHQEEQEIWDKLLKAAPEDKEARSALVSSLINKGRDLLCSGQPKQQKTAGEVLTRASALAPDEAMVWAALAVYQYCLGTAAAAEAYVEQALAAENPADENRAGRLLLIGDMLLAAGKPELGRRYMDMALKQDRGPDIRSRAALSFIRWNYEVEGMRHMQHAFRDWQYELAPCMELVAFLASAGEIAAEKLALLLLKHHPQSSQVHTMVAMTKAGNGDYKGAWQHLNKARKLAITADDEEALRQLDDLLHHLHMAAFMESAIMDEDDD